MMLKINFQLIIVAKATSDQLLWSNLFTLSSYYFIKTVIDSQALAN